MKKVTFYLMMIVMSLSIVPTQMLAAEKNPTSVSNTPKEVPAEVKVLLNRLDEIKAMDKSSLNSTEKKNYVKKFVRLKLN